MSGWESFHQVLLTPGYTPGCLKPDHGAERRDTAGKNRPLDEDELHFVEKLLDHERQKDQSVREEEKAALDAFQQVSGCACSTESPFTALCQEDGSGLRIGGLTAEKSDVYYPSGQSLRQIPAHGYRLPWVRSLRQGRCSLAALLLPHACCKPVAA